MEVYQRIVSSEAGDILLHFIDYPNGSIFVWATTVQDLSFDDFHVAVPDKFARLPAVSTRMGDTDSIGRFVALRLSQRLKTPVVVSWSLPGFTGGEGAQFVEAEILKEISFRRPELVNPAAVGA